MKNILEFALLVALTAGLIIGFAALLGAGFVGGGLVIAWIASLF